MAGYIGAEPPIAPAGYADWIPLQTADISWDASVEFSGMTSDFDEYKFQFVNIHPQTDAAKLRFNVTTGESFISTFWSTYHHETSGSTNLGYEAGLDTAGGLASAPVLLSDGVGNDADQCGSGYMILYGPMTGTTYEKHFMSEYQHSSAGDTCNISRVAGYIHTPALIDRIQFSCDSGYLEDGKIIMYGLGK